MPGRREDLRLKVLGEFEARVDDRLLPLGGRQQRALLLTLALEPGRTVAVPRLVDRLWGERPPRSAVATLHAYVSRLRTALPDPGRTLVTTAGGYTLDVEPEQVDSVVFETLADRGRAALAANRAPEAAQDLRAALDLWRGPCLPEFAAHAAGQGAIDRLEGLRALTQEDLLEADLARGLHHDCVGRAEELVREKPLRERAWAALALALYRCGRQAEALESLRTVRRLLAEDLGVEPAPALRRLERLVLTQDPSLDLPETLPVTAATASPAVPPATTTPWTAPGEVGLVGRVAELDTLRSLLTSAASAPGGARVVVVEGEAGVGKTTLVRRCAFEAESLGALPVWVSCTGTIASPALWPWITALRDLDERLGGLSRFGVTAVGPLLAEDASTVADDGGRRGFGPREAIVELLMRLAAEQPVLLVIDDLHLADRASLEVLDDLAPRLGPLRVLLVAIHRGGPGESVTPRTLATCARHVPSLTLLLRGLDVVDVRALLGPLADTTHDLAQAVTWRTGGNPFFVGELVRAARSQTGAAPGAVLMSEVPSGVRDVVRARLLDLPAQAHELVAVAAVLGRTFHTHVLAEAAGLSPQDCAAALEPVVARGLAVSDGETATRLRFTHAIVRDTVLADLSALRVARLHARCALALRNRYGRSADHAEPIAHHVLHASGLVDSVEAVASVLVAADVAASRGAHQRADDLLEAMSRLLLDEPASPARDAAELSIVLRRIRLRLVVRGFGLVELSELVARAEVLAASTGGWTDLCEALCAAAVTSVGAGDTAGARRLARRAVDLAEQSRDPGLVHDAHQALARVAFNTGRLEEARAALDVCLTTIHEHDLVDGGNGSSVAPRWFSVGLAGFAASIAGDSPAAQALADECRSRATALQDTVARQTADYLAAWVAAWDGDLDGALHAVDRSLSHRPELLSPYFRSVAGVLRAWLVAGRGDPEAGLRDVQVALDQMASLGALPWVTYAYSLRAEILLWCGDVEQARRAITDAASGASLESDPYGPEVLRIHAEILAADPHTADGAQALLDEGLRLAAEQGAGRFASRLRAVRLRTDAR